MKQYTFSFRLPHLQMIQDSMDSSKYYLLMVYESNANKEDHKSILIAPASDSSQSKHSKHKNKKR